MLVYQRVIFHITPKYWGDHLQQRLFQCDVKQIRHGTFTKACYLSHSSPGIFCRLERAPRRPQRLVRKFLQRLQWKVTRIDKWYSHVSSPPNSGNLCIELPCFYPFLWVKWVSRYQHFGCFFATYGMVPCCCVSCIISKYYIHYPLVNIQKTMENHHFEWENQRFLWPFSIAIFVYQRVYPLYHTIPHWQFQKWI